MSRQPNSRRLDVDPSSELRAPKSPSNQAEKQRKNARHKNPASTPTKDRPATGTKDQPLEVPSDDSDLEITEIRQGQNSTSPSAPGCASPNSSINKTQDAIGNGSGASPMSKQKTDELPLRLSPQPITVSKSPRSSIQNNISSPDPEVDHVEEPVQAAGRNNGDDEQSQSNRNLSNIPGGWRTSLSPNLPPPHRPAAVGSSSDPLISSTAAKKGKDVIRKSKSDLNVGISHAGNVDSVADDFSILDQFRTESKYRVYIATSEWEKHEGCTGEECSKGCMKRRRVKVGHTNSGLRRQDQYINKECGFNIHYTIETVNSAKLEKMVHTMLKKYADFRKNKNLHEPIPQYIKSIHEYGTIICPCARTTEVESATLKEGEGIKNGADANQADISGKTGDINTKDGKKRAGTHRDVYYTTEEDDVWLYNLILKLRELEFADAEKLIEEERRKAKKDSLLVSFVKGIWGGGR